MKLSLLFVAVFHIQLLIIQAGHPIIGRTWDWETQPSTVPGQNVTTEPPHVSKPVNIPEIDMIPPQGFSQSCRRIKQINPNAPSKMYSIVVRSPLLIPLTPKIIDVYCEMGLDGGGYTFLTPESVVQLHPSELLFLFTERTSFLLRVRKTDGSQPYAVLKQLPQYANISLKLGLSDHAGYNAPLNSYTGGLVGQPFLYFGFLPKLQAASNSVQGLQVNGFNNVFTNCDRNPNSHFTLFPNFPEATPSAYDVPGTFCNQIFSRLLQNPSGRVMPPEIYMFGETHWGGCGCYKQTNQIFGILSFAIGFR